MNRGLINKSIREAWAVTLLCGLGLLIFEALIGFVFHSFREDLVGPWLEMEFVQDIVKGLVGSEIGDNFGPAALNSIAWVHPIVLALVWAHEITLATRIPAGEVDRGTIDVLLGLPVSRWRVYLCETAVGILAGVVVIAMGLLGNVLGNLATPQDARIDPGHLATLVVNLYCLYLAVGGLAMVVSALSDRRGRAVAVAFGIVVASFVLNFLAQFSQIAKSLSFLSLLSYYRPLLILREAAWPVSDMIVLAASGALLWGIGGVIFARRDICTV